MLNQCHFIGNLGQDPEVRSFSNGGRVCNLRLAVSKRWKDKATGERKEATEWVSLAIFSEGLIGVAEKYLRKGSKIYAQGELRTRKYQDQAGADRYSTEVVLQGPGAVLTMLDGAPATGNSNGGHTAPKHGNQTGFGTGAPDDLDDEVPFVSCDPRLEGRVR